ncbi:MAG: FlgD immunoglobulin-like domain containing protein [bacterium]
MRTAALTGLLALTLMIAAPIAWAGIPVAANCELWASPDTAEVRDTIDLYVVVRDLYGEVIPGMSCDFFSDRGATDVIIGTPDESDEDGLASARITTVYEPFFSVSHITVDIEGVTIGPISLYWECRAGVDPRGREASGAPLVSSNAPNPFGSTTEIRYSVGAACEVGLEVFDVQGKIVRTLTAGAVPAGSHTIVWDGKDQAGRPVPSGVYYVRTARPSVSAGRSVLLLR